VAHQFEPNKSWAKRVFSRTGTVLEEIEVVRGNERGWPPSFPWTRVDVESTRVRPDGRRETVFGLVSVPSWSPDQDDDEGYQIWLQECSRNTRYVRVID